MPSGERVLIVEDEEVMRELLTKILARQNYRLVQASSGEEALRLFQDDPFDLVLTDLKLAGINGLELLTHVRALDPEAMVIMMTAYASVETAVEAMRRGAYDYITKPFDFEELSLLVRRALEVKTLTQELHRLKAALKDRPAFDEIVGESQAMQEVFKLVGQVADSDATVLIQGESGTGKELIAKAIHTNSQRSNRPFVTVNCAAIPKDLLESELFGHERGAFTGAVASRRGKFELADGGIIFLDEIGEMDPALQTKILRVLQERRFERLGGEVSISADVRILAATHRDLETVVRRGGFREDLFYRLNVVTIKLPPLRERREDLPLLVTHFLRLYATGEPREVSPEALQCLMSYHWPGNVRELENVIKRACLLARTRLILPEHFPETIQGPTSQLGGEVSPSPLGGLGREVRAELKRIGVEQDGHLYEHILSLVERPLIQVVLERAGGNQLKAAKLLGINRNTFRKRMKKLGISWKRASPRGRKPS